MYMLKSLGVNPFLIRWMSLVVYERKVILWCSSWSTEPTIPQDFHRAHPCCQFCLACTTIMIMKQQISGTGRILSFTVISWYSSKEKTALITSELEGEFDSIAYWCINSEAVIIQSKASVTWFSLNNHSIKTECIKDTPYMAMRFHLYLPTIAQKISMGQAQAYLKIIISLIHCTQNYAELKETD